MKHIWSILCQNSSVDDATKRLSIFNCVEELGLTIDKSKSPKDGNLVLPITFQLISFWILEDKNTGNSLDIKVELFDPAKQLLSSFQKKFNIPYAVPRFRSIMNINGIKITKEGRYIVKVSQKENRENNFEIISNLPIDVKIAYQ